MLVGSIGGVRVVLGSGGGIGSGGGGVGVEGVGSGFVLSLDIVLVDIWHGAGFFVR